MNEFVYKLYVIVYITLIRKWLLLMNEGKLVNEWVCLEIVCNYLDNIDMHMIVINEQIKQTFKKNNKLTITVIAIYDIKVWFTIRVVENHLLWRF